MDILAIGTCCLICGGEGFTDMATFGKAQYEWLRGFLLSIGSYDGIFLKAQRSEDRLLPVPLGVGVGIGIGIDSRLLSFDSDPDYACASGEGDYGSRKMELAGACSLALPPAAGGLVRYVMP